MKDLVLRDDGTFRAVLTEEPLPEMFAAIERTLNRIEDRAREDLRRSLLRVRDALVARISVGDAQDLALNLRVPEMARVERSVLRMLQAAHDAGREDLRDEVTSLRPHDFGPAFDPAQARRYLRFKAREIKGLVDADLQRQARGLMAEAVRSGEGREVTEGKLRELFEPYVAQGGDKALIQPYRLETIVRTNTTAAYNHGRLVEGQDPEVAPFMQGWRYSAILDARTTEVCRRLNGRVFRAETRSAVTLAPPRHFSCRSILVPVVVGEDVPEDAWETEEDVRQGLALSDVRFGGTATPPSKAIKAIKEPPIAPWDTSTKEGQWHKHAYTGAPEEFQRAIQRNPPLPGSVKLGKGAHYNPNRRGIQMRVLPAENSAELSVWRHEYGHYVDDLYGEPPGTNPMAVIVWRSAQADYQKAMLKDTKNLVKKSSVKAAGSFPAQWAGLDGTLGVRTGVDQLRPGYSPALRNAVKMVKDAPLKERMRLAAEIAGVSEEDLRDAWGELLSRLPEDVNPHIYMADNLAIFAHGWAQRDPSLVVASMREVYHSVGHGGQSWLSAADLAGAMTDNRIGGGHSKDYYHKAHRINPVTGHAITGQQKEAFANVWGLASSPHKMYRDLGEMIAPEQTRIIRDLARDIGAGKVKPRPM